MKLILIAAIAKNRVIGNAGKLPWHISEDLKRFKKLTTGHTILMGRKTFESIGKPLPNRRNIILTSQKISGIETYPTIEKALEELRNEEKVFVIGGGEIYQQTLPLADELYLTFVEQEVEGDTFFPEYEKILQQQFQLVNEEIHEGYCFRDYVKK